MNNSSYLNYGQRILYKIDSYRFQIPAKSIPHIEIQQLDTITWAPKQVKEKVDMNTYSIFNEDLSLIGLINKARPNIHNPHNISTDIVITADTKESRLGLTSSTPSPNSRRMVFTRGLKNLG